MNDPKPDPDPEIPEVIVSATISAVVIRADGTEEDLGVIASSEESE